MKEQEEKWKGNECSLMTDAWFDRNRRSIMNLCVNCKVGTCFISSIESSEEAHTAKYKFEYVDKYIGEIGSGNVIQVVTDNTSNNNNNYDKQQITITITINANVHLSNKGKPNARGSH